VLDLGQGGLAGLDSLPGEVIRINDWDAARSKHFSASRFAHADTAG
jgi:hypothetical protein